MEIVKKYKRTLITCWDMNLLDKISYYIYGFFNVLFTFKKTYMFAK